MAKKGKPERGLYQVKNSPNWYYDFTVDGIRYQGSTRTSNKTLAREIITAKRTEALRGEVGIKKKKETRFFQLCEQYLEATKEVKRSHKRDLCAVKVLKAFFGNRKLRQMEENEVLIRSFVRARTEGNVVDNRTGQTWNPASRTTVNRELALLKAMFNKGRYWKMCSFNPVVSGMIDMRAEQTAQSREYLTEDEARRYIEACSTQYRPVAETALMTGMRKNEILTLKWDSVDLNNSIIYLDNTKSGRRREVRIPTSLTETLSSLKYHRRCEYVFLNRDGKPYRDVRRAHNSALKKAGIDRHIRFHDLRHSFGTLLAKNCKDLNLVKQAMGHADIKTTLRYAHVIPDHQRAAIEGLSDILRYSDVIVADFGIENQSQKIEKSQ